MNRPLVCGSILALGTACLAQTPLTAERVAFGLSKPLGVTAPPGDTTRVFILEQRGSAGVPTRADIRILMLANNALRSTPFLTLPPVTTENEQGLLGMAFHPDYAQNGFFYVHYTNSSGNVVVARYRVSAADPHVADPGSALTLMVVNKPAENHNGGWIAFGPDGFLYFSVGDGGGSNDEGFGHHPMFGNGQFLGTHLGKLLRIDVDTPAPPLNYSIPPTNPFLQTPGALPEIWAYGLRNPWRNAFDRLTGDLYIADVGQQQWEEVNVEPGGSAGGFNYGWRCHEGNVVFNPVNCQPPGGMVFPVHVYSHAGACSITGGYVYRGCAIPDLQGTYFYADFCSSRVFSFRYTGTPNPTVTDRTDELYPGSGPSIFTPSSFGEDARGELYVTDLVDGEVFRIMPDGVPSACVTCYPDCDGDQALTLADFGCFQTRFAVGNMYADCDGDQILTLADFGCFQTRFALGCP